MMEIFGDLWTAEPVSEPLIVRCVTVNGTVNSLGRAVMGRGCAYEATQRFPVLRLILAGHILQHGNTVMGPVGLEDIRSKKRHSILTFPVKHQWHQSADIALIRHSASQLAKIANQNRERVFILPRPGCGYGHLTWDLVRVWLKGLPNNVMVITNQKERL